MRTHPLHTLRRVLAIASPKLADFIVYDVLRAPPPLPVVADWACEIARRHAREVVKECPDLPISDRHR